jgi:hypothetical protein
LLCKVGIHLGVNPNSSTIDIDSITIRNVIVRTADSNNGYGVRVAAGDMYNLVIDKLNVSVAKYCVWVDLSTTPGGDSVVLTLNNCKFEQGDSSNKDCWGLRVDGTGTTDNIKQIGIYDTQVDTTMNGIYLRDVYNVIVSNCQLSAGSGYSSIDIDDSGFQNLTIINSFVNNTATLLVHSDYELTQFIGDKNGHIYGYAQWVKDGRVGYGTDLPLRDTEMRAAAASRVLRISTYSATLTHNSALEFFKSRSDTSGTLVETIDNEEIGVIAFQGVDDASSLSNAALITVIQDGAAGTGEIPAEMIFETYSSTAKNTNQLKLLSDGGIIAAGMKTGTTQGGAGAAAGELWSDTDDDNTVKLGV